MYLNSTDQYPFRQEKNTILRIIVHYCMINGYRALAYWNLLSCFLVPLMEGYCALAKFSLRKHGKTPRKGLNAPVSLAGFNNIAQFSAQYTECSILYVKYT